MVLKTSKLLQTVEEELNNDIGRNIDKDIAVDLSVHKSFKPFIKKSLELCPFDHGPYAHEYKRRLKLGGKFLGRKVLKIKDNGDDIVTEDKDGYTTQKHRIVGDNPEAELLREKISKQGFKLNLLPPVFVEMPDGYLHVATGNGRIYAVKKNDVNDIICDLYDFSQMKEVDAKEAFILLGQMTNPQEDKGCPSTAEDYANSLYELYQIGKMNGDLDTNEGYNVLQDSADEKLKFMVGNYYFKPSEYERAKNIFIDRLKSKRKSKNNIIPRNWSKEANRLRWMKTQSYVDTKYTKYVNVSASIVTKALSDIGEKYKQYVKKLPIDERHKLQICVIINSGVLENNTIEKQVVKRNQDYYNFQKKWFGSIDNNLYYYKSKNNNSDIISTEEKIKLLGGMPYFRHNNEGDGLITVEQIKKLKRTNVREKKNV